MLCKTLKQQSFSKAIRRPFLYVDQILYNPLRGSRKLIRRHSFFSILSFSNNTYQLQIYNSIDNQSVMRRDNEKSLRDRKSDRKEI